MGIARLSHSAASSSSTPPLHPQDCKIKAKERSRRSGKRIGGSANRRAGESEAPMPARDKNFTAAALAIAVIEVERGKCTYGRKTLIVSDCSFRSMGKRIGGSWNRQHVIFHGGLGYLPHSSLGTLRYLLHLPLTYHWLGSEQRGAGRGGQSPGRGTRRRGENRYARRENRERTAGATTALANFPTPERVREHQRATESNREQKRRQRDRYRPGGPKI